MKILKWVRLNYKNFKKNNFILNSIIGRKIIQNILETLFFVEDSRRKKIKDNFIISPKIKIPEDNGFLICPSKEFKFTNDAVNEAEKIFQERQKILTAEKKPFSGEKGYLREIPLKGYLEEGSPIMNFALDDQLLATVSDYLGTLPVLREIRMMYSPNDSKIENFENEGSQLFHVDKEYPRMMKVFLLVTPSTVEDGPLTVLPANKSRNIWGKMGKFKPITRVKDEQVFETISKNDVKHIVGEKGSIGFLDVARCLHYGSRPNLNSKPRLIIWFVYHHFCSNKFPFSLTGSRNAGFSYINTNTKNKISEPYKSILKL